MRALRLAAIGPRRKQGAPPIEHSMLLTAALCLVALGAVMVFSASSTTSLLGQSGDSAYYLKRTVLFGAAGLVAMRILAVRGVGVIYRLTPLIMAASIVLLFLVLIPGVGVEVNGARRWLGAGVFQIQPSEIAKVALVLHGAALLATRPTLTRSVRDMSPFLVPVGLICLLVVAEPDLGTGMVACFTCVAMLVAAGAQLRHLALLGAVVGFAILLAIAIEPYRMERLTGFLSPASDPAGAGFQANQAQIALGSGGLVGVGIGESLQKAFYLPEAHTDMIAAVIGEELGLVGIVGLVGLYGLFGYAGLRIAQRARDRYGKLLAVGLTSLVLVQAVVNLFAVLGLAPLTGVPLPFVSYGNSSMLVMLAAVGLLLNVARGGTVGMAAPRGAPARAPRRRSTRGRADGRLGGVEADRSGRRSARAPAAKRSARKVAKPKGRNSSRGNRGTRGSRARGRRRATG